jgi:hypothetical protein
MKNKQFLVNPIASERSRLIGTLTFEENQSLALKLPLDTVLVGLYIRIKGSVKTTYASGTPVAKAEGAMDALINRIDVTIDGQHTVKSVTPHLLHMQALFTSGIESERFSSAGASISQFPTTSGTFAFGTTGQITSLRESVYLPFEMVYCEPGMGREETYLNLKQANSAEIRFSTNAFSNILGYGNTAPVVWSDSTLQIEVWSKERQDIGPEMLFDQWKQTYKKIQISSESSDLATEIAIGNYLTGLMLFAKDGAAGSTTTATGKLASNLLVTNSEIKRNGSDTIQRYSFPALQAKNRQDYGVNASFSSGVSRLDGIVHHNFISRRDLGTAMPKMRPFVDQLNLVLDTNSSSNVSYTNPAEVTIMQEEWIPNPNKR